MDQLLISARLPHIAPDKLADFKKLASELVARTRSEPGVLYYSVFLNAEETVAEFREVYVDSDAVLAHLAACGALIGPLAALGGGLEIGCYGTPSPKLMDAAAAMSPTFYRYLDGK
ncbi:MAG: antibiotic biosynthesis monooxygenase [Gemmatimonas sp.]